MKKVAVVTEAIKITRMTQLRQMKHLKFTNNQLKKMFIYRSTNQWLSQKVHRWANLENMKKYYLVFLVRPFSMVSKASENFDSVTTSTVGNVSNAWVARLLGRVPEICKYFVFLFVWWDAYFRFESPWHWQVVFHPESWRHSPIYRSPLMTECLLIHTEWKIIDTHNRDSSGISTQVENQIEENMPRSMTSTPESTNEYKSCSTIYTWCQSWLIFDQPPDFCNIGGWDFQNKQDWNSLCQDYQNNYQKKKQINPLIGNSKFLCTNTRISEFQVTWSQPVFCKKKWNTVTINIISDIIHFLVLYWFAYVKVALYS